MTDQRLGDEIPGPAQFNLSVKKPCSKVKDNLKEIWEKRAKPVKKETPGPGYYEMPKEQKKSVISFPKVS